MDNYLQHDAFTDGVTMLLAIQTVVSCSATEIGKSIKDSDASALLPFCHEK